MYAFRLTHLFFEREREEFERVPVRTAALLDFMFLYARDVLRRFWELQTMCRAGAG